MNIEAYNLDSLRKLVRKLQAENHRLKEQLKAANIPFDTENVFEEKIENTEEYDPDQWDMLLNHTKKLTIQEIEQCMAKWQVELAEENGILASMKQQNRPKLWKKKESFVKSDVIGKMHIVLGDGVYIDTLNLMPRLQNQIRSMAAFDNPVFYKNKRLGYSNYYNFSAVYMGKDIDGWGLR